MSVCITDLQTIVQEWVHNGVQQPEGRLVCVLCGEEVFTDQLGYGCRS
jgi:hypothetical protein